MKTHEVILALRNKAGLSQEELAQKIFVTRQAVSRWEQGETVPNTETLKRLSQVFDVSINTLLGSPRKLICQCCGMPLEDPLIGRNKDGSLNEDYCKWCYADGIFTYSNKEELLAVCVGELRKQGFSEQQAREYMEEKLPKLAYWRRHEEFCDGGGLAAFKDRLVEELNGLSIEGMPKVEAVHPLVGSYVNLAYGLPSGERVKFLDDDKTYWGNQLPGAAGSSRCFGVLADKEFLLVCTYEEGGKNSELLVYRKR
ncbi:Helix-turn-helix [Selenomonas ruminantium]|uniref:Helix-turn-helix n=1 Tax=Selenomonas ruminantium TaxID=971 RepID=A0A1I3FTX8_SELRU|nr:zinc ribbon domain-containing protein [Selenomonas ruminantium]SFI14686.1 Helix-turn-helix [Selenomonas ruminantium]